MAQWVADGRVFVAIVSSIDSNFSFKDHITGPVTQVMKRALMHAKSVCGIPVLIDVGELRLDRVDLSRQVRKEERGKYV
jgi:hypothetical protein